MFQVNKSSSDFWNNLKVTWQQCADLPNKDWVNSVAELNGKVYVTVIGSKFAYFEPLVYDCSKDKWSTLPALPYAYFSLVTVPDRKQLLAIGGMVNNNGWLRSLIKCSYGMRRTGSGPLHTLTCTLHDVAVQVYPMDQQW